MLYARRQSLQEATISAEKAREEVNRRAGNLQKSGLAIGHVNVLFALRTDRARGFPPASEYLSAFVKANWSLESLAMLEYDKRKHGKYHDFGAPICEIYDSYDMVRNPLQHQWLVGQVRNHFGWA